MLRDGSIVKGYKVSLFGGLGAFFYALSYDENGNKLTLADLDYGVTLGTFTINKTTIQAAWTRLASGTGPAKWDVINFAPAYNGKPDGDFSADKALIKPAEIGLDATKTDDGKTYSTQGGYALLNLVGGKDEWKAHDLRSYLQRPVLSMAKFLEALTNVGQYLHIDYELDITAVPSWLYEGVWKTLPTIPSLGSFKQAEGSATLSYTPNQEETFIAELDISGTIPSGARVTAKATMFPGWQPDVSQGQSYTPETTHAYSDGTRARVLIFMQLLAYSGDTRIGGSKVKCLCDWTSRRGSSLADAVGFSPWYDTEIEDPQKFSVSVGTGAYTSIGTPLGFEVSSNKPTHYILQYRCYRLVTYGSGDYEAIRSYTTHSLGVLNANGGALMGAVWQDLEDWDDNGVTYSSPGGVRSGAVVEVSQLLQSEHTPAEYLIAFAKMHGLVFRLDPDTNVVRIVPRDSFFSGQITDLSGRIDRSQQITIQPLSAASKWYELAGDWAEGAFAEAYKGIYGTKYGIQRVNTDYDFDDKAKDLMQSLALKGAVTILDNSAYWCIISDNGAIVPSLLVDSGNTYTLWDSTGKSKAFNAPCPPASAAITYYNTITGYDIAGASKLEFRDADNGAVDGTDVLCLLTGFKTYQKFHLSDDSSEMLELNGGKPCWDLTGLASASVSLPCFARYDERDEDMVDYSLDYGIPREVAVPDLDFDMEKGSLYLRHWRAYLSDLLNENTKVMKCRVDFRGLEVGPELLRRFYHYEGALWVLNKITNYSLTTYDPVECEFVQVQNPENYTNGQILN